MTSSNAITYGTAVGFRHKSGPVLRDPNNSSPFQAHSQYSRARLPYGGLEYSVSRPEHPVESRDLGLQRAHEKNPSFENDLQQYDYVLCRYKGC